MYAHTLASSPLLSAASKQASLKGDSGKAILPIAAILGTALSYLTVGVVNAGLRGHEFILFHEAIQLSAGIGLANLLQLAANRRTQAVHVRLQILQVGGFSVCDLAVGDYASIATAFPDSDANL